MNKRSEKAGMMEASSAPLTNRNDFRRTVEKAQVHAALQHTLGIIYPTAYSGRLVELVCCGNCPRHFTRNLGTSIKYCGICIAAMKA